MMPDSGNSWGVPVGDRFTNGTAWRRVVEGGSPRSTGCELSRYGNRGNSMLGDLLHKLATLTRPTGLPVVWTDRHVWHVAPAGMNLFGPAGPQLNHWITHNIAVVVKSNPARTVYRVELPDDTIYVKHCRITGPRAWGRELIRPPKARLEFDNAVTLRMRGVPAVEPLAWGSTGSRWPGESFLITRGIAAIPFLDYLQGEFAALSPDEQVVTGRQITLALADFFARLHDAGVAHPDPHPGNLLMEMLPCRIPRFTLIDLHDVRVGTPLSWVKSRDNLTLFNRYFQMRTARTERARFWHQYRRSRASLPLPLVGEIHSQAKEVEDGTNVSNLRLWSKREGRWLGSNRTLRKVKRGHVRGLAVRDIPEFTLRALLEDPDAVFARPDTRILKDSKTSTVAAFSLPTPTGPMPVILKRVNVRSWAEPLKNLFRRSAIIRSWVNGHTLRDRGIPTPRPLAAFHRYRNGLPAEGYILTDLVPDAVQLDVAGKTGVSRAVWFRLARILRAMHDRGVSHRDLKAPNILLSGEREPVLIDLVGVRTGVNLTVERRAKELTRLCVSFLSNPTVTHTDRLRFLLAYLAAGTALQVGWKSWWELVSRATAEKVARNHRVGRALS
ncbi:MAG: hypothetical protein C0467_17480 [Planctomycetaceae bacterium]|nr:hypothetical protein [Planctomycetaceae bacterium]